MSDSITEVVTVRETQVAALENLGNGLIDQAKALIVVTGEDRVSAANLRSNFKAAERQIAATVKLINEDWDRSLLGQMHKRLKKAENEIKEAVKIVDKKNSDSILAEQRAAERERRAAEAAAYAKAQEEAVQRAIEAEQRGDIKHAEQILEAPVVVQPITLPVVEPQKIEGLSTFKVTDFEILDGGLVPRDLCSPDEKKIRERVRALGTTAQIPGVRVFERIQSRERR